jgi:alkanesulfonate monooxygenase SsuD/methylene tetrahydromethanopterin reductase-like flavin-dependent oxidoreductase (luciferase family)
MRFGVFLPSFVGGGERPREHAAAIRAFARRAEELGFDSLWITDHVVTARAFYGVGWLDALTTLAHVAAVTERVRLGTSILILPLRRPALLAKEVATLHYLSGGRYVYGIGTGWFEPEFAACGVAKADRGRLTDEVLDATLALLRGGEVQGVGIEPRLPSPPPVWSAGGSQLPHDRSVEAARMHPNVLRRIAAADGWIARPTCPPELIAADLARIPAARAAAGRHAPFTVAHENFTWIQERGDVEAVQRRRFGAIMGDGRPWDYIDAVYMPGSVDEIQAKVQARIDAGVEYLMLHTLDSGLEQLELIARHVVEPFSGSAPEARSRRTARAGRGR